MPHDFDSTVFAYSLVSEQHKSKEKDYAAHLLDTLYQLHHIQHAHDKAGNRIDWLEMVREILRADREILYALAIPISKLKRVRIYNLRYLADNGELTANEIEIVTKLELYENRTKEIVAAMQPIVNEHFFYKLSSEYLEFFEILQQHIEHLNNEQKEKLKDLLTAALENVKINKVDIQKWSEKVENRLASQFNLSGHVRYEVINIRQFILRHNRIIIEESKEYIYLPHEWAFHKVAYDELPLELRQTRDNLFFNMNNQLEAMLYSLNQENLFEDAFLAIGNSLTKVDEVQMSLPKKLIEIVQETKVLPSVKIN